MKPSRASDFDERSSIHSTSRPRPSTAEIAEVLVRCHTRKQAAAVLGIPPTTLERICREQALVSLYEQLAERGKSRRSFNRPEPKPAKRWSFFWKVSDAETVCVWPDKEVEAMTEQEALKVFKMKIATCMAGYEITAVEVLK